VMTMHQRIGLPPRLDMLTPFCPQPQDGGDNYAQPTKG